MQDDGHEEDEVIVLHRGCYHDEEHRQDEVPYFVLPDVVQLEIHRPQRQGKAQQVAVLERRVEQQGQREEPREKGQEFFEGRGPQFPGQGRKQKQGGDVRLAVHRLKDDIVHAAEELRQEQFEQQETGLVRVHAEVAAGLEVLVVAHVQAVRRLHDVELVLFRDDLVPVDPEDGHQCAGTKEPDLPLRIEVRLVVHPFDERFHFRDTTEEEQGRREEREVQDVPPCRVVCQEDLLGPVPDEERGRTAGEQQKHQRDDKKQPADEPFVPGFKRFHKRSSFQFL